MLSVCVSVSFDAAHRLLKYDGKCSNLHGHRYTAEFEFSACEEAIVKTGSREGMIADFSVVKNQVNYIIKNLDHAALLQEGDPLLVLPGLVSNAVRLPSPPTAEVLVMHLAEQIKTYTKDYLKGVTLTRVRLYETATCWAEWRPN